MTFKWTFQRIITLSIAGLVLVPLLVSGISLWYLLNPGLERQQFQNQAALAGSVAAQVESFLNEGVSEIRLFAAYLEDFGNSINPDQLQQFVQLTALFEVVYLVDEFGVVQLAGVPESSNIRVENLNQLDISRMDYFQALMKNNAEQWSDAFLSSASGELVVAYSMELDGDHGYRYLTGELGVKSLPALLQGIQESSGQTVMILDAANQLIGHPQANLSRQQINLSTLPILNAEQGRYGQIGQFEFQEVDYYGALIRIPDPEWKIIVALPVNDFWGLLVVVFRSLLVVLIIGLFVVLGLSRWVGRRLNQEFSAYRHVAERLAQGSYEITPPPSAIRELNQFSQDLIKTGEAIAYRERQLAQSNTDLERHVEERTRDLLVANDDLNRTLQQLRNAQRDLIESGKLAALGSLVAGVSHELNTPIGVSVTASTSVVADAKALLRMMSQGPLSKKEFTEGLELIIEGSELIARNLFRASELISSFKQVAVDQSSDQRRSFVLDDVVQDVISTLMPKFKGRPFEFAIEAEDRVEMDSFPGSLIQVLTNLVDNAVFHGYDGRSDGVVRLTARRLSDGCAEVVVEDFGLGISEQDLKHIFEPFYTSKLGQGGSGLGLNIVHSMVQKVLGGRVDVASQVGVGTRFTLTLPVKAPMTNHSTEDLLEVHQVR